MMSSLEKCSCRCVFVGPPPAKTQSQLARYYDSLWACPRDHILFTAEDYINIHAVFSLLVHCGRVPNHTLSTIHNLDHINTRTRFIIASPLWACPNRIPCLLNRPHKDLHIHPSWMCPKSLSHLNTPSQTSTVAVSQIVHPLQCIGLINTTTNVQCGYMANFAHTSLYSMHKHVPNLTRSL